MASMRDFVGSDGLIGLEAYTSSEVADGMCCCRCKSYIFSGSPVRTLCWECKLLDNDRGRVVHPNLIRCPHCGFQEDIRESMRSDADHYAYEEGTHYWVCSQCEGDYEIVTRVSHEFMSPPPEMSGGDE